MRNTLKGYREKLGMTQEQMASFLGVHRVLYNRWENQRAQPTLESLFEIWKVLKTEFPDLHMENLVE